MASWLEIALNLGKSFTNTEVTNTVFPTKQSYIQNALHLRRPIAVFSQIFNHFKKRAVHCSTLSGNNLRQDLKQSKKVITWRIKKKAIRNQTHICSFSGLYSSKATLSNRTSLHPTPFLNEMLSAHYRLTSLSSEVLMENLHNRINNRRTEEIEVHTTNVVESRPSPQIPVTHDISLHRWHYANVGV